MNDPEALAKLEAYLESCRFQGYDCYDALNSPFLSAFSFGNKFLRTLCIQALKRSPINLRPILGVRKGHNPKGVGLFLSASALRYRLGDGQKYLEKIRFFANLLAELQSTGYRGACWGYNFDWQSRAFFAPKGTPTIVNTAYIAHGFLDAFEATGESSYRDVAVGACRFILQDLPRTTSGVSFCFSYTPLDQARVHNANVLGAGLLARVYAITGGRDLKDAAAGSIAYTAERQNADGSWFYGEASNQRWIDGFHTGFVLESLDRYRKSTGDGTYDGVFQRGFDFYWRNFFLGDGTPKYYHDRTYPIDIHNAAEAIVVLARLGQTDEHRALSDRIVRWTLETMQDADGHFYFQKHRRYTNRIPYIRWSQAWMYYALNVYRFARKKYAHTAPISV